MSDWTDINFTQVVDKISTNGKKVKQKEYLTSGRYPVIDQGQDFIGGYSNSEEKKIGVDSPVIVFGDHTKVVKLVKHDFVPGADGVKVLLPKPFYNPRLLSFFINVLTKKIPDKGYARHFQFLEKENIPLLPQPEQEQLVSLIEQLFSDLDNAIDNLKKAKNQLKIYRQSVLKYAFEGKLCDAVFETRTINDVALSIVYGTSEKALNDGIVPVLRMGDLIEGKINYTRLKFYRSLKGFENLLLQHGDLLFNRTNSAELVGKTSIFKGHPKYKQIVYASYLIRVRVDRDKIIPDYLNYWMNSPEALLIRNKLKNQQVGQANINGTKLKGIKFPFVADLKIQEKIVQEIESRFSVCDKMEEAINNSLEQAEALRQSILKQAFEGKLTEEWRKKHLDLISSENSAKALLERIKKERGALKNTKKRKK
jgi:type I restriction enzyme S subunit